VKPIKDKIKCLNPACVRPAEFRGLCHSCYEVAAKMVRAGQTTWERLVAIGRAHAPRLRVGQNPQPRKWLSGEETGQCESEK